MCNNYVFEVFKPAVSEETAVLSVLLVELKMTTVENSGQNELAYALRDSSPEQISMKAKTFTCQREHSQTSSNPELSGCFLQVFPAVTPLYARYCILRSQLLYQ